MGRIQISLLKYKNGGPFIPFVTHLFYELFNSRRTNIYISYSYLSFPNLCSTLYPEESQGFSYVVIVRVCYQCINHIMYSEFDNR